MQCARKGGHVAVVGAYAGYANHFAVGTLMEKQLTLRAGQTPCQRYWPALLPLVEARTLRPSLVVTHEMPLADAAKGYELFDAKADGCIKVVLHPGGAGGAGGVQAPAGAAAP